VGSAVRLAAVLAALLLDFGVEMRELRALAGSVVGPIQPGDTGRRDREARRKSRGMNGGPA